MVRPGVPVFNQGYPFSLKNFEKLKKGAIETDTNTV